MSAIRAESISKSYLLGGAGQTSIRDTLAAVVRPRPKREVLKALEHVSFDVQEGETLGIIGRNGAGKSTLLKILSRITRPTSGRAEIRGRVGSLLEVGTGFHPELTGRENIYLNGVILGMKRNEINRKFDEIVNFSEIEKFLDTPVKHYSSGMYMRLAFSIAAHFEPEVLIVDEVLAVGDAEFQAKCIGKMDEVSREGLAQICTRGLLLHKGKVVTQGPIQATIAEYLKLAAPNEGFRADDDSSRDISITQAFLSYEDGVATSEIAHNREFFLDLNVRVNNHRPQALFCVALLNKYRRRVFTVHTPVHELTKGREGDYHLRFAVPGNFIAPNNYSFVVQAFMPSGELIHDLFDICPFSVIDAGSELAAYNDYGYVQMKPSWRVIEQ
jgi:lipopolysaccharide transport system ATP-binding protein